MAYDEELAARVRELVADEQNITEQKMFGGLAFLIGGNLAVAASGQGGLLVHVDPAKSEKLQDNGKAYPMEMRGKEMAGWLRVDSENVRTKAQLKKWIGEGTSYAKSLPAKKK